MALPDLTGQYIQNTYQKVLTVGDGGNMYDGTGSLFIPLSASHEIIKEVSSSYADTASLSQELISDKRANVKSYVYIAHGTPLSGGQSALYLGTTHSGMDIVRLDDSSLVLGGVTQQYGWRLFGIKHGLNDGIYTTEIDNFISTGSMKVTGSMDVDGVISGSAISSSTYYGDGSNLTGISSGITWVETTQSANFTAETDKGYLINVSGSEANGITVILPDSPSFGDQVALVDSIGSNSTATIYISSSNNIIGSSIKQKMRYNHQAVQLMYTDAGQGWTPIGGFNSGTEGINLGTEVTLNWLVIAGGGGGGSVGVSNYPGGGGGAGGFRTSYGASGGGGSAESTLTVSSGDTTTIIVGAGGAALGSGAESAGNDGADSTLSNDDGDTTTTITSNGGGGGGGNTIAGRDGGSGGGGSESNGAGGSATAQQGYDGGTGSEGGNIGGGGGGASAVGSGTDGGAGLASTITGASVTYAGGGASSGTGGSGGGGDSNINGTANTGGGGGATNAAAGGGAGAGGSGIIIIRYPAGHTITAGAGLTLSTSTDGDYKVTTFTAGNDTISF